MKKQKRGGTNKNRKGVFFSSDALLALIIILMSILVIYPVIKYSKHNTGTQADVINVMSTLKTGEIDNDYVRQLILEGKITDLNKSIIEQIGEFYVTDIDTAKALGETILASLNTNEKCCSSTS